MKPYQQLDKMRHDENLALQPFRLNSSGVESMHMHRKNSTLLKVSSSVVQKWSRKPPTLFQGNLLKQVWLTFRDKHIRRNQIDGPTVSPLLMLIWLGAGQWVVEWTKREEFNPMSRNQTYMSCCWTISPGSLVQEIPIANKHSQYDEQGPKGVQKSVKVLQVLMKS